MNRITKAVVDRLIDGMAQWKTFRHYVDYTAARLSGFQYDSYSIADEVALALSFIKHGRESVVIDAGANRGDWASALFAQGFQGRLIAIEPNPVHKNSLLKLEQVGQLLYEGVALGRTATQMPLFFDTEGSTLASLYQRDIAHHGYVLDSSIQVPVDTLSDILERNKVDHVDYLKLDLEGHELAALEGAANLLKTRISALSFEFGGTNIDSRTYFRDFYNLLSRDYGFALFRVLANKRLLRLTGYREDYERFVWQNILACSPGTVPKWKILE